MKRTCWLTGACLMLLGATGPVVWAQRAGPFPRVPEIGYVYPAGGQQGSSVQVTVGGQFLQGVSEALISGEGITATVVDYHRPLNPKELNELRNKLEQVQKKVAEARKKGGFGARRSYGQLFQQYAREAGLTSEDLKALQEYRRLRSDPKRQPNPQIEEQITLQLEIAPDAKPGLRQLRLATPQAISNPVRFCVDQLPEVREQEPNDQPAGAEVQQSLPLVINGQILPGDVDRFRFEAFRGQRLVVAVRARALIPYLADAVPGWFQATVALYDAAGREVAFADDYRFHPDPVLFYEVPADGQYTLEIRDALYRGREDFVYRVAVGQLPWITSIFPLGARRGDQPVLQLQGWNLPTRRLQIETTDREPAVHWIGLDSSPCGSNRVPFAVDTLPERGESEPNDTAGPSAEPVGLPVIINGRIDRPGDRDVFRLDGRAGQTVVAEVYARRLDSPVDSALQLTDASGQVLAANDDHRDAGSGLTTHHADSYLKVTLPADGTYFLHLRDAQEQGGSDCAYRLRISQPRPDFELRVVPSSVNARPGAPAIITAYALRKDGFDGDITLQLKNAPPGATLSGGWIPAGQDHVRLTVTVPAAAEQQPVPLELEGQATINGRLVRRRAVPADDMMQAFIYHHLVPADQLLVAVGGPARPGPPIRLRSSAPVTISPGQSVPVRLAAPRGLRFAQLELQLDEAPEGISIEAVRYGRMAVTLLLRADSKKVQQGLKGNLIVRVFVQRSFRARGGTGQVQRRQFPVAVLPAIPFQVVAN